MLTKRLAMRLLLALASIMAMASGDEQKEAKSASPVPGPDLTPAQVMEIQIEALQFNDKPAKDAGIATAFRFASPENQKATGPLERFALIVKGPAFQPLINHRVAGYDPILVKGDLARRRVTVIAADGQAIEYEFRLSKDSKSGCWFTDGVIPNPAAATIDPGRVARNVQTLRGPLSESFLHLLQTVLPSEPG